MADLGKEFLTAAELAALLSVSRKTVDRLVRRGALACYRIGRARRFRSADIEIFLAKCRVTLPGAGTR